MTDERLTELLWELIGAHSGLIAYAFNESGAKAQTAKRDTIRDTIITEVAALRQERDELAGALNIARAMLANILE